MRDLGTLGGSFSYGMASMLTITLSGIQPLTKSTVVARRRFQILCLC